MVDAPSAPSGNGLLVLVAVASCVVFIAGAVSCDRAGGYSRDGNNGRWNDDDGGRGGGWGNEGCGNYTAWALCCGLIAFLICVLMLLGDAVSALSKCTKPATPYVGLFLSLWWLIGACIITFAGPYRIVSNGYLGAWVACFGSILYGLEVSEWVKQAMSLFTGELQKAGPPMFGLIIASCVELIDASIICNNGCQHYVAYAVSVGAISLGLTLLIVFGPKCLPVEKFAKWIVLFLFLWWLCAAIILTFISPFVWAGNGYFATWVAVICAALIFKESDAPGAAQVKEGSAKVTNA